MPGNASRGALSLEINAFSSKSHAHMHWVNSCEQGRYRPCCKVEEAKDEVRVGRLG